MANRLVIKPHYPHRWWGWHFVHGHLNDSMLVPVALPVFLWVYGQLKLRHLGAPTLREVLGHALIWSVTFEWFAPNYLRHSTGDVWDVVSYFVGGLVAWLAWRALYGPAHAFARNA